MFTAQLKDIRLNLGQAFLPIYNAALPALTSLATALANATRFLAEFSRALFGYKQAEQTAQISAQTSAVSGLGDAYEKAGKQAQKAVAGFDQVNLIGGESGAATPDIGGVGAIEEIDTGAIDEATGAIEDVSSKAQEMADKVRESFSSVLDGIRTGWKNAVNTFGPALSVAGNRIKLELDKWKGFFNQVFSDVIKLGEPLKNWWQNDVVSTWDAGVNTVTNVFVGLSDTVRNVFESTWASASPIIDKFVVDGLPRITEFVSGVISVFDDLFDVTKGIFDDIWRDAIDPAIKNISSIIQDGLDIIFGWWDDWGRKIIANIRKSLDRIRDLWENFWNNLLKPLITTMLDFIQKLWDEHLQGLIEEIGNFVGKLITAAQDIFNEFILPIVNWLIEKLGPIFADVFEGIGNILSTALGVIIDVAREIIKILGGIIDFLTGVFAGDWERAWEGIKDIFIGILSAIGSVFKGVINTVIDAINWLIRQMNKISVDIPEWVPKFGGQTFGINIPEIPKLDTGTNYVPHDMLAVIHEGEAVVPKEYNPAAGYQPTNDNREVVTVLRSILRAIQQSGDRPVNINLTELSRQVTRGQNDLNRRAGRTLGLT